VNSTKKRSTIGTALLAALALCVGHVPSAGAVTSAGSGSQTAQSVSTAAVRAGQPSATAGKSFTLQQALGTTRVASTNTVGSGVSVSIPGGIGQHAEEIGNTTVVGDAAAPTVAAIQSLGDGTARILLSVKDPAAPREFRFPVTMPKGAKLVLAPDGSVSVTQPQETTAHDKASVRRAQVLAVFAAPWAADANGKAVPTRYTIQGTTLVQHISPQAGAAYPLTVDPTVTWTDFQLSWDVVFPNRVTVFYNKRGTSAVLSGQLWIAAAVVAALAATPCSFVCAVGGVSAVIGAVFFGAAPQFGLCGKQTFTAWPWPVGLKVEAGVYRGAFCT
jgi:hypothetical protein